MRMQRKMVEKQKINVYLYLLYFLTEFETAYQKGHRDNKVNKQKMYMVQREVSRSCNPIMT